MNRLINTFTVVSFMLTMTATGCNRQDKWEKDRPRVYKASGVIFQDGQPLSGAIVTFQPTAGDFGGTGVTDANGRYQLTTFKDRDGGVEGEFRVTVEKTDWIPVGPEPTVAADGGLPLRQLKKVPKTLAKYARADQSGFSAQITPKGPNQFDFQLDSKAE